MNKPLTLEEANELNSNCAFCGRLKFEVRVSPKPPHMKRHYELRRCSKPASECYMHCHWDHQGESIQLPDGREDTVEIASGWNS